MSKSNIPENILEECYEDFEKIYDYINDESYTLEEVLDNIKTICEKYID